MKPPKKPAKKRTAKQRLADSLRKEGRGMQYRPADEGPYDRVIGKDMRPDTINEPTNWYNPPHREMKMAKGGAVPGKTKRKCK
jgi:hypothetical protein